MKLSNKKKIEIEKRIRLLLYSDLDWCVTNNKDKWQWFGLNNPYTCEAFGLLHTLQILGYMNFGPINVPGNLSSWFYELKQQVKEEGERLGPSEAYHSYRSYLYSLNKKK